MGKFSDIPKSFIVYAAVSTVAILLFLFLKKDNIVRWIEASLTVRRQKEQIEWYRRDNARLDYEAAALASDRDSLEAFARTKYDFAEPGDDVYIVK